MSTFSEKYPMPGQVDPLVSPCAFCRRRILVDGKPVFSTCSCKELGPSVTIWALAVGAAAVLAAGVWWWARRR